MKSFIILMITISMWCNFTFSQQILLNESYDDWNNQVSKYVDKNGDGNASGIDISDVRISNDNNFLFIYFDLNKEINLQDNNYLALYLDLDNQTSTGFNKYGIGADLIYYFGSRNGKYYTGNSTYVVFHNDLGLVTSPTVTSDIFEMCIARKFKYDNGTVTMANTIKVVLSDEDPAGDKAPDATGGYFFSFDNNKKFIPQPFSLKKEKPENLRFMTYNVLKDQLFDPNVEQNYRRIFKAINPDIIGLCEIYDHSSEITAGLIEKFLPSTTGKKWYYSSVVPDVKLVSRYPVINTRSINGNGAFLIDLGTSHLVYIVAHLPCCDNETQRQQEVDNIMSFVRNIRYGLSVFQTPLNTPVIISGDMNLVGLRKQLQTFITGDIADNASYGPDFKPDWDDSNLEDASPFTTNLPHTFTWYNELGTYSAGRLDYFFYTGSVVQVKNSFTLWSPALTAEQLSASGIQTQDVPLASDHLPVICDFLIGTETSSVDPATTSDQLPFEYRLKNYSLTFSSEASGKIKISDIAGRVLYNADHRAGTDQTVIDLESTPLNGLYLLTFSTKSNIYTTKIWIQNH